jgi:hypothetical protein
MAGFYVANAHPWAASALFSAELPGPTPLPYDFSPEEVTMLLDHGAAIRRIHEELALLRELLTGRLPPPRAFLPASSTAALPTPSTGPFELEKAEKMLTRQVSAVAGCSKRPPVTTPSEIIPYYHLNHSVWSLSDNKESSR